MASESSRASLKRTMANRMPSDPDVITVYLGQFPRDEANRIAEGLEEVAIPWWYKEPGFLSQIWEFGVRIFVDRERLEDARQIVARVEAEWADRAPGSSRD